MLQNLLNMTWYNPIFMLVLIGSVWFVPGIVVRRIAERKYQEKKKASQKNKIDRLYPKDNKNN